MKIGQVNMNREFLMLAKDYNAKYSIAGWFMSEKLNGMRAFWDGGITRCMKKKDVPFANHTTHDDLECTGLWSRYANVIYAPNWWLDTLPKIPLDGELYIPSETRQTLMSIIKGLIPDSRWTYVFYYIFDSPSYLQVFQDGFIGSQQIDSKVCLKLTKILGPIRQFESTVKFLNLICCGRAIFLEQTRLSFSTKVAEEMIQSKLRTVNEGVMLRKPESLWIPIRSSNLLKIKNIQDDEGIIIGWIEGKGKLKGMLGSLKIEWKEITFDISGFTDEERQMEDGESKWFKKGKKILFEYRGLTKNGTPDHATYKRDC